MLVLEEAPDPEPAPGEVLVRLRASALNHLDVWVRKGLPSAPKPHILGADGAGVVEALGDGVSGLEPGSPVVLNPGVEGGDGTIHVIGEHGDGTNAELIAVPAANVYPIPDGLSFEDAAAFPMAFVTAYRMLVTPARLQPDEWVLVWGIGGGVSTAALAISRALGARTIVTSSSDEKLARARELGADAAVNHASGDVKAAVREATEGHGADIGGSCRALEHQQIIDQPRQPVCVVAQVGKHLGVGAMADRVLDVAAERGDRGAQLVRGVGEEPSLA